MRVFDHFHFLVLEKEITAKSRESQSTLLTRSDGASWFTSGLLFVALICSFITVLRFADR